MPDKQFEVILSFEGHPQQFCTFTFSDQPTEAEVLFKVLDALSAEHLQALRKLSFCQLARASKEDHASWLDENDGKYYFSKYKEAQI